MAIDKERVKFIQGDACNLPEDIGQFHCAIAGNLLDRLPDPAKFLREVGKFILPGGFLILLFPTFGSRTSHPWTNSLVVSM